MMNAQDVNCINNHKLVENLNVSCESDNEEMKTFKTSTLTGSMSDSESDNNLSKQMRKEKSEKSSKRTMDDVLKRLNKYNNNENEVQSGENHFLESAFGLAALAASTNDRHSIQETEQRLTLMIEQLQHLRHKLVSSQQVAVRRTTFNIIKYRFAHVTK